VPDTLILDKIREARGQGYSDDDIIGHLQSHPTFGQKIREAQEGGYGTEEIIGHLSSAREHKDTRSPLTRAAQAFKESLPSLPAPDWPKFGPRFREQVGSVAAGIANIPMQVWSGLTGAGESLLSGKPGEAAFRAAGAVPIVGPPAQQIATEVGEGKYAEAAGHAGALAAIPLAPALLKTPGAIARGTVSAGKAVGRAANAPGVTQIAGGAAEAALGTGLMLKGHWYGGYPLGRGITDIKKGLQARKVAAEKARQIPATQESAIDSASRADWERLQAREAASAQIAKEAEARSATVAKANEQAAAEASQAEAAALKATEKAAEIRRKLLEKGRETEAEVATASDVERLRQVEARKRMIELSREVESNVATGADVERLRSAETRKSLVNLTTEQSAAEQSAADAARLRAKIAAEAEVAPPSPPPPALPSPPGKPAPPPPEGAYPLPVTKGATPAHYEAAARTVKSRALARLLNGSGISVDDAARMTPEHWDMAAKAAGVKAPSATSVLQVIEEMKKLQGQPGFALPKPNPTPLTPPPGKKPQ